MNWINLILPLCLFLSGCSSETSTIVESASATSSTTDTCRKDAKTLVSWNVMNFGSKKSDEAIKLMSDILLSRGLAYKNRDVLRADIVLLQEVNAGPRTGGAQAVYRLQQALGQNWDSITSDATSGSGTERYAIMWEKSAAQVNRREAKLIMDLADTVDREPYGARISIGEKSLWIYAFHAVPIAKNPIREAKLVVDSEELISREAAILAGDFNLGRMTVSGIFTDWNDHIDGKTSLRSTIGKDGGHLSYHYDHIFTKGSINVCESGIIDFVSTHFSPIDGESLKRARELSDHLPVYIRFTLK